MIYMQLFILKVIIGGQVVGRALHKKVNVILNINHI